MTSQDFVRTGFMEIAPTLAARDYKDPKQTILKENGMLRVRKLTPRECGRLMGVSDEDISAILSVNSNSQAYKQFGNSIVVDVLAAMFQNIFDVPDHVEYPKDEDNLDTLTVEEILALLGE